MPGAALRWLGLPLPDQLATAEALLVVLGTRIAVGALPTRALSRWVSRAMRANGGRSAEPPPVVARVTQAVRRASLRVPGATCLVQALAGWLMLERRHVPARIDVGVQKQADELRAHAWLVVAQRIVLGGEDARARYVTLGSHGSTGRQ
ncbi:MAG: lasso peptide biosynthesis B2 protein [Polyangiaceae bacterium]|nr:lasso peptide biosynthesis B2 protein [Polyangiaceae bacterium]